MPDRRRTAPDPKAHARLLGDLGRATRIVATVGPASEQGSVLRRMIRTGADIFRFNMSHGSHEEHARRMGAVRAAARDLGRPVGILVDLQGPKLRTARNEGESPIPLRRGSTVNLVFRPAGSERSRPGTVVVQAPDLSASLARGDTLLLDDGRLRLEVIARSGARLKMRVLRGGALKDRAGVNLPGRTTGLRVPTSKDLRDVRFAVGQGADFVALSFVQSAQEVRRMRRQLARLAGKDTRRPLLVAKLEKPSALDQLDAILEEVDGVMVARGDLGVELSLEKVPLWQKEILRRARSRGIFTITATQMLESMVQNAVPTRAEVSDVANAVLDGTDALMLSAESAVGLYPVEAVEVLQRAAREADRWWLDRSPDQVALEAGAIIEETRRVWKSGLRRDKNRSGELEVYAVAQAAVELATRANARWIVVFTVTGRTAQIVSRYRPPVPILALSPLEETRRKLALAWNTWSLPLPQASSVEEMMQAGLLAVRGLRRPRPGELAVLTAGTVTAPEATNLIRLVSISPPRTPPVPPGGEFSGQTPRRRRYCI